MTDMKLINEFLDSLLEGRPEITEPFLKTSVIEFIKANENPSDEELHNWAASKNFDKHKVEEIMYQLATLYVKKYMK